MTAKGAKGKASDDDRARLAAAGHSGPVPASELDEIERAAADADPSIRALAVAALVRGAPAEVAARHVERALHDDDAGVRRRAAEVAPRLGAALAVGALVAALGDREPLVAEAAAFALGEHPEASGRAVHALVATAGDHRDPLVREAAVAALGAIGHPDGKLAVLAACADKPAIRRRAVIALAAFDGDDVEAAIRAALADRDWQVRQAAEDLSDARRGP
jgi:HEAT repeat protein